MTTDQAERVAIDILAFLAGDQVRLNRFMAMSGIEAGQLRQAAREPAFLAGVLAHVAGDERTLIDFAAASGHSPDAAATALRVLGRDETGASA